VRSPNEVRTYRPMRHVPSEQPGSARPLAVRRRNGARMTLFCTALGILCAAGVVLAVLDPAFMGRASGPGLTAGAEPVPATDDNGFVPPRLVKAAAAKSALSESEKRDAMAEQTARESRADALIQKLLVKLRKEREARTAERKTVRTNR